MMRILEQRKSEPCMQSFQPRSPSVEPASKTPALTPLAPSWLSFILQTVQKWEGYMVAPGSQKFSSRSWVQEGLVEALLPSFPGIPESLLRN